MAVMKSFCGKYEILVDDEDVQRCIDYAKNQQNHKGLWSIKKKRNGYYVRSDSGGKSLYLHRFIMNAADDIQIDHANNNGLDNQKSNLREATSAQNSQNRRKRKGKSIYKGVTIESEGRFRSTIYIKGKKVYLGMYRDEAKAALAYNKAAKENYGEFAKLNVIPEQMNDSVIVLS